MTCSRDSIHAYLDEELDAAQRTELERHIDKCPRCAAEFARLREQKAALKAQAPYYDAPPALAQSICAALRQSAATETVAPRVFPWRGLAIAASLLLAVSAIFYAVQLGRRAPEGSLTDSIVAGHIQSLLGTHLLDVPSSDRHTVKPWFGGKLDFSPDVQDFPAEGFALEGGRVDYLAGRRVAALVYRRRLHVINLFTWPAGTDRSPALRAARDGYHVLHWTQGSMTYWAVSDVAAADLDRLRDLYQGNPAAQ